MVKFLLCVNENPIRVCESVEEAKQLAVQYMTKADSLRIESATEGRVAAKSSIWNYDKKTQSWIVRK